MTFEVISEEGHPDYEIWTCPNCGHQIALAGVGGDVAECPECIRREAEFEASMDDRFDELHGEARRD